ncbi:hypothetical protein CXP39_00865 [Mesoplasma syrphidae]|uniref:ABC transporter permease n=1 Tax=Mesoplasma syrphidae TaxID=225999 RepID=A0A2K9C1K7_9MOLU|nr:ABC transporter permease subunit [Mesoplasma syrphidae]AUF83359.1 hypothetical protein CXP39_00865 [Mesoplasma syrphidae]
MFNLHLLKKSISSNWILWSVTLGASLLIFILFLKTIGSSAESNSVVNVLGGFLTSLGINLPLVYIVVTGNKLVAVEVEKGDMAYYLSTPLSRTKILTTKMIFFSGSVICWTLTHFVIGCIFIGIFNISMPIHLWTVMTINWTLLLLSFAGISWLASCYFNKATFSLIFGAGIPSAFIVLSLLASIPQLNIEYLNYLSLLTLFKPEKINISSVNTWLPQIAALLAISVFLYGAGIYIFKKRDLPL